MNNIWSVTKLGEVALLVNRPETPIAGKRYRQVGVRLWGEGAYERESIDGSDTNYKTLSQVEVDDIIVNKIWARNGSVSIITPELSGGYVSSEFPTFVPVKEKLEPRWFYWLTKTKYFWNQCDEKSHGTSGKNRIRPDKFLEIEIPLPPLEEQRRIVARIAELAAKVEEARGLRREAVEDIKSFSTVSKLNLFQHAKQKWGENRLSEVVNVNMGQSPPGDSYNKIEQGFPLLNGPTEFGETHPTAIQWTTEPTKFCKKNDILLCVRGATTGKMNWADKEYCIGRGLAALTANIEICVPMYAYYFVETQTQEMLALSAGSTFPNLPSEKLKKMKIPIPPLEEQHRIVEYLNDLQIKIDAVKQLQTDTQVALEALLPSILDKAFKGEL
jgi:type I restriction enzyme S subunit